MEQLRHRLTNVSPKGQRCSVDQNTLKRTDLDDFIACYNPKNHHERKPTWSEKNEKGRWRAYDYSALIKRDKINLDIFWLKDESLEDSANLPDPGVIALEITEDLESALAQFSEIANDLSRELAGFVWGRVCLGSVCKS